MAKDGERTPEEWRDLLAGFRYPEETKQGHRRVRRQARRDHRDTARRQTKEWVREQRRRDPLRPAGALIIVLVILGLGVGARFLWPGMLGQRHHPGAPAVATATANPTGQTYQPNTAPPTPSSSPSSSPTPAADLSNPDHVARDAIQLYLTRNPPEDGDHTASVLRAAPYLTPALVENLTSNDDPAWNRLVSRGGVSTVHTVTVSPAGTGLPADTPIRVWRKVTAKVDVEGYTHYSEETILHVEVTNTGDGWQVSRILGL